MNKNILTYYNEKRRLDNSQGGNVQKNDVLIYISTKTSPN